MRIIAAVVLRAMHRSYAVMTRLSCAFIALVSFLSPHACCPRALSFVGENMVYSAVPVAHRRTVRRMEGYCPGTTHADCGVNGLWQDAVSTFELP